APAGDHTGRLAAMAGGSRATSADGTGRHPQDRTVEVVGLPVDPVLAISEVDASYGQVQVLFGVNLAVGRAEAVGLLGTNGSGKSTTLKVASGLLKAGRGRVWFEGEDVTKLDPVGRVKRGLVMVPSGRSTFPSLTVRENLRLAGWLSRHDPEFLAATERRVMSLFPSLERRLDTQASALSGGEQQMLTIAQALYCKPRLLMIDELSLGLAPAVVAELLSVVRQLTAEGITVVVVEQSLNLATSMAERAVFMERGQVRFSGPTAELTGRTDLVRSVFLGQGTTAARTRPRPTPPAPEADGATAGGPAFSALELGRSFGTVKALQDVTFDAQPGEIVGIIGANGAGKTTLFDICSGYLPGEGRVWLGGLDITGLPAHERADRGLGRVFQDARLFPSLTVSEVLAVALDRRTEIHDPVLSMMRTGAVADSEAEVAEVADELIERLGLTRYRDSFVSELSTGTRRVVELACVMAHQPSVLLLDEPTSGLAQRESEALGGLLLDLREQTGTTLIMIEHDVPLVSSISDRLICLDLGQIIAEGPPAAVLDDPHVIEAYLGADDTAIARSGRARRPLTASGRPRRRAGKTVSAAASSPNGTTRTRTTTAAVKGSADGKKAAAPARARSRKTTQERS
ncbi:MAG TPA: ATP-binding cassette domain-containing protein, partial [Acidimicrobiales bacterium]|nr:ATP-binding cassette domain-containing protein [Acidimicrobiales bacterium]